MPKPLTQEPLILHKDSEISPNEIISNSNNQTQAISKPKEAEPKNASVLPLFLILAAIFIAILNQYL